MNEQWKTKGFYFTRFWELFCGLIEFQYFQTYHGNRRTLEFLPKTRKTAPTKTWNVWENITKFNKKQQIACNSKSKFKKCKFSISFKCKIIKIFFLRNRNWGGLCTTYILDWTSSFSKWRLNHVDDNRMIHLILNITITCSASLVHHPLWLLWHFECDRILSYLLDPIAHTHHSILDEFLFDLNQIILIFVLGFLLFCHALTLSQYCLCLCHTLFTFRYTTIKRELLLWYQTLTWLFTQILWRCY